MIRYDTIRHDMIWWYEMRIWCEHKNFTSRYGLDTYLVRVGRTVVMVEAGTAWVLTGETGLQAKGFIRKLYEWLEHFLSPWDHSWKLSERMNVSLGLSSVARVMIAQWENECISLSVLSVAPGHDSSVEKWMYLTVCPFCGPGHDSSVKEWMYLTVCPPWPRLW